MFKKVYFFIQKNYQEAKKYYEANGDLLIPSTYIIEREFNLGYWVYVHRQARNNLDNPKIKIDEEKIELLDKIGTVWETMQYKKVKLKNYKSAYGSLKMLKKIFLSTPTMHVEEQIYIKEAFDTNWVAPLGANVDNFEIETAKYVGVNHAAALVSGTSAIHLAVKLAGVKPGDIVFCSDLTFAATANPISYEHAQQVFIDSEYDTWNMSPEVLEKAFKKYPQCKAVIIAHLYGTPAKMDEIIDICKRYNATLIEDAAESLSSKYKDRQTGTFGKYGILSFNSNKIITTSGGGMLLSNDEADIKKARFWATQSRDPAPHYQHSEIGYNYRMSNIVAGIGRGQLIHLDEHKESKKTIYDTYKCELSDLPIKMNPYEECSEPNFWLSCITIEKCNITPEMIRIKLEKNNIESRHIWKPMHLQPVFADRDYITINDAGSDIFNRGLCLPSDIKMTADEQMRVIEIIKSCF